MVYTDLSKSWLVLCILFLFACSRSNQTNDSGSLLAVYQASTSNEPGYELFATYLNGEIVALSAGLNDVDSVFNFSSSKENGLIAFEAGKGGLNNLYTFDPNRKYPENLTGFLPSSSQNTRDIEEYVWSPEGKYIAYSLSDSDSEKSSTLNLFRFDTKENFELVPNIEVNNLYWSPNGRYLAFTGSSSILGGLHGIYLLDIQNLEINKITPELLTNERVYLDENSWSPQNNQLIYLTVHPDNTSSVFVTRLIADSSRELSVRESDDLSLWKWSFDGTKLAFISDHNSPNTNKLYTLDSNANSVLLVSHPDLVDESVFEFHWSPKSNQIVYRTYFVPVPSLYLVDADGAQHIKFSEALPIYGDATRWSPDGNKIAFGAFDPSLMSELFVYDREKSSSTIIEDNGLTPYELRGSPLWSSTSNRLLFEAESNFQFSIFISDEKGSNTIRISPDEHELAAVGKPKWNLDDQSLFFLGSEIIAGPEDIYIADTDIEEVRCLSCSVEEIKTITQYEVVGVK